MVRDLIATPITNLKTARELFNQHRNCVHYKHSIKTTQNIKLIVNKNTKNVINLINIQR